ncbi:NAD-dependent deacylase [Tropicimonas isoalkanivorans]|uniref:NAD-dependent protein deacylase n=1 Tax=Tropicimonas isoalkanivorans TaxID=441112 RepID=A0A1I1IFU8_9RHOB|nr:NAD-dependent deacylase [Tropicimonas isoalkanivorans]SFC35146.1 NAD-dependent deacetylase [Tropicimonas isoalkanivorans]
MRKIVILTGAGISAESGLGTFRDAGGIWSQYDLAEVATPEGFARNPVLVHDFYNARRANARAASPNAAHLALARLQREWPGTVVVITQNIDDLHERAGQSRVIHMHGELAGALCAECGAHWEAPLVMHAEDPCPECGTAATRPDVVWFGEMPYDMDLIEQHLSSADLFASVGTSGQVFPAAGFVMQANAAGAETVELNLEPSELSGMFDARHEGPATQVVPEWVARLLSKG